MVRQVKICCMILLLLRRYFGIKDVRIRGICGIQVCNLLLLNLRLGFWLIIQINLSSSVLVGIVLLLLVGE